MTSTTAHLTAAALGIALATLADAAHAELAPHRAVRGAPLTQVSLDGHVMPWEQAAAPRAPGKVVLRWTVPATEAVGESEGVSAREKVDGRRALELPTCAGRGRIALDGAAIATPSPAPVVVPLGPGAHEATMEIAVSAYERRVACGAPARVGAAETTTDGLAELTFASPHAPAGGGRAVVLVPPGHDARAPAALLVGLHPWNGGPWTYAAYAELLAEAAARDVVLLFPSGLGNSLYTEAAEDEVMRAIDALAADVAIDPRRVSIFGASMGGAGATTIAYHRPDRFARVTSFFGDAKYDLRTYVKSILPDEAAAHRVNALDVVDNARHLSTWLVHGEDDHVSPIAQSELLARALEARGFAVRFDRVPRAGHEGALVAARAAAIVDEASTARAPDRPSRVTYESVRAIDTGAYGVTIERAGAGDAFVDVERRADAVHVLRARGVRAVWLAPGALGTDAAAADPPIVVEGPAKGIRVGWRRR